MSTVRLEHLSVYYENAKRDVVQVLKDVSFSFEDGEFSVLVGASGSGKTTLLRTITGSILYNGHVFFDGKCMDGIGGNERKIAYVNQDLVLYPMWNVYENIAFGLRNERISYDETDQRVKSIAEEFGLTYLLTRKIKQLSIGQASRVALAKAIVRNADILLLDEPFANLDRPTAEEISRYVKNTASARHMTTVLVTHDMNEALRLADRIYLLDEGRFVKEFTPDSFFDSRDPLVEGLLKDLKGTR